MKELKLHRSLYRGAAIEQALRVYTRYATVEQGEELEYWVVRVSAASPAREQRVARELANYALGLTVAGLPR